MMKLDRESFIKAAEFVKAAILISEQPDVKNYVHVKIMGERCQLTAADGHCGKRVTLFRPAQLSIEETETPDPDQEYLINRATLLGFVELCKKHKAEFKEKAKRDHTLRYIDIGANALESHADVISYEQPSLKEYPEIDAYFVGTGTEVSEIKINADLAAKAIKEFPGVAKVTFSGNGGPIAMESNDGEYQAFFLPIKPVGSNE
jgi:DNA polymerase III sliding clamp (beta) subunit (PCNA family)